MFADIVGVGINLPILIAQPNPEHFKRGIHQFMINQAFSSSGLVMQRRPVLYAFMY